MQVGNLVLSVQCSVLTDGMQQVLAPDLPNGDGEEDKTQKPGNRAGLQGKERVALVCNVRPKVLARSRALGRFTWIWGAGVSLEVWV